MARAVDNDSTMKLSHVVVPLFVAGHAFAQAPGEPQEVAAPGASEAPAAAPASEAPPVDVAPPGMAPVVAPRRHSSRHRHRPASSAGR